MTILMARYADLNTEELFNLTQEQKDFLEQICDSWSFAYETLSPGSCANVSFNFHTWGMHLNKIIQRYNGRYWQYSTEGKLIHSSIYCQLSSTLKHTVFIYETYVSNYFQYEKNSY